MRHLKIILSHLLCAFRGFFLLLFKVLTVLSLMIFAWCLMAWQYIAEWPIFLSLTFAVGFASLYRYYDTLVLRLRPQRMRLTC